MIQRFTQHFAFSAPRRVVAVLLAILLNVALVPCTMALELVESGDDCCPPELRLDPSDCCQVDDLGVDTRGLSLETDDEHDPVETAPATFSDSRVNAALGYRVTTGPPDDPTHRVAIHKLNCVYLI
jgi:hypothetical protein